MNPHVNYPSSVRSMFSSLWRNRQLIARMTRREVVGRYRGSVMGVLWSLLTPLFMLVIYTFVFSVVFKARWGTEIQGGHGQFATILFAGLIIHGIISEVLNRAPQIILSNVNYVKKVVFPLEILPVVQLLAALFNAIISIFVLLIVQCFISHKLPWTVLLFPLIVFPFLLLTLGLAWMLASLGVFARDVGQGISLVTSVLLFTAPIFFPLQALPEFWHPWMQLNPLTFIVDQARNVLIFGEMPSWSGLLLYFLISISISFMGFKWFQKTRKGFADVL